MATYKGTHGTKIQNYTTDPDNPLTGQVWFNATAGTLKFSAGALSDGWATGNSRNNGVDEGGGSGGNQTAGIAFSGSGSGPVRQKTEFISAYASLLTSVVPFTDTGVEETFRAAAVALPIFCQPVATFVLVCH